MVNPLAAAIPIIPQQSSPYYPSSRRFLNPLYLSVEKIPGAAAAKKALEEIAKRGRALNSERLIDRDAIYKLKMSALEKIWAKHGEDPAFEKFSQAEGKSLHDFAAFCTLAGTFQQRLAQLLAQNFPTNKLRRRDSVCRGTSATSKIPSMAAMEFAPTVQKCFPSPAHLPGFTPWASIPLVPTPGAGRTYWAPEMSIGAPPDAFNNEGQNWGMQPFIPHRLRASFYEPFRQTLHAILRFGGGLRIDHVMGDYFVIFWIPRQRPAEAKEPMSTISSGRIVVPYWPSRAIAPKRSLWEKTWARLIRRPGSSCVAEMFCRIACSGSSLHRQRNIQRMPSRQ